MPQPTKLDMKLHLRSMARDKTAERESLLSVRMDPKEKMNLVSALAIDIACLNRCLALVEATMPEQMATEESLQES